MNPEAHVHPRGQVEIGRLIARAAENGIQIFVETHSDHIFNGIRLEFQRKSSLHSKCKMYYAVRSEAKDRFESKFEEIILAEDGKIKSAPVGFFDEWESAMMELL
jgi:predicted ATPase